MELIIGVVYLAALVFFAPRMDSTKATAPVFHNLLIGLPVLMVFLGLNVLLIATASTEFEYDLSPTLALIYAVFSVSLASIAWVMIQLPGLRQWISIHLIRSSGAYDPDNGVHTTALISVLFMLVYTAANFVLLGGQAGVARALSEQPVELMDMIASTVRFLAVALIGVGFMLYRDIDATLMRLGLRLPTSQDVLWGILAGVGAFALMFAFSTAWSLIAPPEQISQLNDVTTQTMVVFGQTLLGSVLFAFLSGLGEEVLFRGALQPIFGLWWTSLFFALIHVQYWFTPALIIIFIVSLLFGWVKKRTSTNAAIIAHVVYNFLPFLLIQLFSQSS